MNPININTDKIISFASTFGLKLLSALAVFIVGLWIVKMLSKGFSNMMDKRNLDPSLKPFLKSLVTTILRILLIITALSMLGIEMTAFVGILAAAGLAIGMALSGTLQNFAGGIIILIFRPFKVGDFIEVQSFSGVVTEIHIFTTLITTVDNKVVIIPNGSLSNNALTNYTREPFRRVDITVGIAYGDDVELAQKIIKDIFERNEMILNEPAPPFVEVVKLGSNAVELSTRTWCKTEDYWTVFFRNNKEIYTRLNAEAGISIPFPQMDVHIKNS